MSRESRFWYVVASVGIASLFALAWWLLWATWWPVDPPMRVISATAFPPQVRSGERITVTSNAIMERDVTITVSPRIEGDGGVIFLPATRQHWTQGEHKVRRVIMVPELSPGRWTYQPMFTVHVSPLRTIEVVGAKAEFEVVP